MSLHSLPGKTTDKKRVGRGGKRGKTSGKGMKGQKARAGGTPRPAYRDVIKKIPKLRGHGVNRSRTFNPNQPEAQGITLKTIAANYSAGETVSAQTLMEKGILDRGYQGVKILGTGDLEVKLTFEGVQATAGAKDKIAASGSEIK